MPDRFDGAFSEELHEVIRESVCEIEEVEGVEFLLQFVQENLNVLFCRREEVDSRGFDDRRALRAKRKVQGDSLPS